MFENTENINNKSSLTELTNNVLKLAIVGGLGYGIYKLGIYKGWWTPEKWKRVNNEWEFLFVLPFEISETELLDLFSNRFNSMKGKTYKIKNYQKIDPINQFDPLINQIQSASSVNDFVNIFDQLSYQTNFGQFNDYCYNQLGKYPIDFIKDKLDEKEIPDISKKTFLKYPTGVAFFTDPQGNLIFEKSLYTFKGK